MDREILTFDFSSLKKTIFLTCSSIRHTTCLWPARNSRQTLHNNVENMLTIANREYVVS
jgi:hypothetical protein